jgi:hypothetical protein
MQRVVTQAQPSPPALPDHLQRIVDAKFASSATTRSGSRSKSSPQHSQAQRERRQQAFRSLWLRSVANEFGDELDAIRTVSTAMFLRASLLTQSLSH